MVWPTKYDSIMSEFDAMELPGQQLRSAHAANDLDHLLNLDLKIPAGCQRLTGIWASMGQSTYNEDILENMIEAGMNIAILNMNFGTRHDHVECIKMIREAAKKQSEKISRYCPVAIAMRLVGKKLRTGKIAEAGGGSVELKNNEVVRLTNDETYKDRCSTSTVYVDFEYLAEQLTKNDTILLDNETIALKVEVISASTVSCRVERGGILGSYKDVFIPHIAIKKPNFSDTDKLDIEMAVQNQVDIIIISFINDVDAISELKAILGNKGKKISIVANIQTIQGYNNYDAILEQCHAVMITRQELGSDISPAKLPIAQKNMIARANVANKPICISGQLLNSMRRSRLPFRAELLDISNCIIDGADGLVLCAETSVGPYPAETVAILAETCKEAENCIWTRQVFFNYVNKLSFPCDQATGTALAGVLAAQRAIAAVIIVVTSSGKSAHLVAKFRPRCPIVAVTRYLHVARQQHMWRGIIPLLYEDQPVADWSVDLENRVNFGVKWAMGNGFVRVGDPVIVISGWKQGSGFTNTMRIVYAVQTEITI